MYIFLLILSTLSMRIVQSDDETPPKFKGAGAWHRTIVGSGIKNVSQYIDKDFNYTYRLPSNIAPDSYELEFELFPYKEDETEVNVKAIIKCHVLKTTNKVVLNVHKDRVNIEKLWMKIGGQKTEINGGNLKYGKKKQIITIKLANELQNGADFEIITQHKAKLTFGGSEDEFGLNKFNSTYSGSEHPLYFTRMQNFGSRRMFPTFDEPKFKATYKLKLILHGDVSSLSVFSYGPGTKSEDTAGGQKRTTYTFDVSPTRMSSYIFAFTVGKYGKAGECVHADSCHANDAKWSEGGGPIDACTYMNGMYEDTSFELYEESQRLARLGTAAVIEYYCYFRNHTQIDIPYPLTYLWFGLTVGRAMENFGNIFLAPAEHWFYASEDPADFFKSFYLHEVSHYYFGNLATPEDWKDLWLNEAFATYFQEYTHKTRNQSLVLARWIFNEDMLPRNLDQENSGLSVANDLNWAVLGNHHIGIETVYTKGALILLMFESVIGRELFDECWSTYIKAYSNYDYNVPQSVAGTPGLFTRFQEILKSRHVHGWNPDLYLSMYGFLFPYLYHSNHTTVTVKRLGPESDEYEISKRDPPSPPGEQIIWHVPIWMTDPADNKTTMIWVEGNGKHKYKTSGASKEKVKINQETFGYYKLIEE